MRKNTSFLREKCSVKMHIKYINRHPFRIRSLILIKIISLVNKGLKNHFRNVIQFTIDRFSGEWSCPKGSYLHIGAASLIARKLLLSHSKETLNFIFRMLTLPIIKFSCEQIHSCRGYFLVSTIWISIVESTYRLKTDQHCTDIEIITPIYHHPVLPN